MGGGGANWTAAGEDRIRIMSAKATITGVVSRYNFREAENGKKANLWMLVEWPSQNQNAQWPDRLAIKAFGAVAERANRLVGEGTQITAECKIEPKSATDANGAKIYCADYIMQSFRVGDDQSEPKRPAPKAQAAKANPPPPVPAEGEYYDPIADPDGDIPF